MAQIVMPSSATEQGHAFEDLILSYYQETNSYTVQEWSSYLHGTSGQWWQCDGIIENSTDRYLVEAKFFKNRPAGVRDINPERRQDAAQDMACTGLLYISLNGFTDDMLSWPHTADLNVQFITWADLRGELLTDLDNYASVLLDQFALGPDKALSTKGNASLYYDTVTPKQLSSQFPEFAVVPNNLELWLRRLPGLPVQVAQNSNGKFYYNQITEQVSLVPAGASHLSLQEAWAIQDAISGYASRTYNAVRATAEALSTMENGYLSDVQAQLHTKGWETGPSGVRSSLDFLVLLGLSEKWLDGRKTRYSLTPLGRAYTSSGKADDDFFATILKDWLPYQAVCKAITEHGISAGSDNILNYFKTQYAPYGPYARSLFNPNKADGLVRLYKLFGS